jgi:hypothetical protein
MKTCTCSKIFSSISPFYLCKVFNIVNMVSVYPFRSIRFVFVLLLCLHQALLQAQMNAQTSFGKNRVQYHHQFDDWLLYETPNFTTYWYGDARRIAQSALQTAELDFPQVQQLLEHQLTEKIEMLVFSDLTDLKQSNIGEDEVFILRAGETKVMGNKIFVYFDGDHRHLRAQIREGVAGVLINSMLYGANLQEIVQNAVLLNLPGWYTEGIAAYCGEEWSAELDNQLRDLLLQKKPANFDKLAKENPRLAGHAFWYYVGLHFGRGTISNLLYLTRINRSIDAGFLYVLGTGYRRTTESLLEYFEKRYKDESDKMKKPDAGGHVAVKNKKNLPLYQLKVSPDGKRAAWVSNHLGRWRVWVQDLKTGKKKQVLAGGIKNALQTPDYNYPLLAWNPDNQRLAVMSERRDVVRLTQIDLKSRKKEATDFSPDYQRVYSIDFNTPGELVLSASVKGVSDLFLYRISNKQTERITQDFWDELDASVAVIDGKKGILFASNRLTDTLANERLDTILPIGQFDLFFYDLETRSNELVRITQTPLTDERCPIAVDSTHFAFISNENGIYNRFSGYFEPYIAYHQAVIYLKDGVEVKALNMQRQGEWPQERALFYLAPLDSVMKNIDSTQIDSIRFMPVFKKKAKYWNQTNYDRNILFQQATVRAGKTAEMVRRDNKTHLYIRKSEPLSAGPARITRHRELELRNAGMDIPPQTDIPDDTGSGSDGTKSKNRTPLQEEMVDTIPVYQQGWMFQVPEYLQVQGTIPSKNTTPDKPVVEQEPDSYNLLADSIPLPKKSIPRNDTRRPLVEVGKSNEILRFNPSRIVPYRLKFRTDFISTNMDNNLLFEGLDSYAGSPDGFRTPPPGVLFRANFKDLLENYVIEAGFRLPTTFDGAEYYLWFDNKKRRIDRRFALYRKSIVNTIDGNSRTSQFSFPYQVRTNTMLGMYELKYPLDPFFSLRANAIVRQDKSLILSTNPITLESPDLAEQRASLRLSAVYDNTVVIDANLRTGSRAKLFVEAVKRFEFNTEPNWSLRLNKGFMTVVGLDARHYQPLDRRSILAVRLAAATTFGSERILYFMGGVDNWLFPKFNQNIPLPQGEDFAYQTLAANLRGFQQNIRNGNSYALVNTELRVPIFKYFSKKPVMGNFWRNFQLVGFFDVGTAWQGKTPYGGNNPINIVYLTEGPVNGPPLVVVKVNYFRDPLVAGYGFGARATIFGMYLRADYAWGIETKVIQKPILHIALGTDF